MLLLPGIAGSKLKREGSHRRLRFQRFKLVIFT
jgi:hypothetical protein